MSFLRASSLEVLKMAQGTVFFSETGKEEVAWKSDNIVNGMIASFGKKSEWGFFKYSLYMINLKWFIVTSLPLGQ